MSGYNQKAQQNSAISINIDDHIDFNLTPQKFIDFYSHPVFATVDERNQYIMGKTDIIKARELKRNFHSSVDEAIDFNAKRLEWIEKELQNMELKDNEELRKNLKILIIIGSELEYASNSPKQKPYKDKLICGYEDFNTALLICHLFHYACRIEYDDILITSSNPNNFIDSDILEFNISSTNSTTNSPLKSSTGDTSEMKDPKEDSNTIQSSLYCSSISTLNKEFAFAQIGTEQCQFKPDIDVSEKIKPFNKYFLKTLQTDTNTELLVFFIDHWNLRYFNGMDYQDFVERMMDIPAKHITVFNECCYSGTLIELIKISEIINDVFDISQTDIFQILHSIANNSSLTIDEKIQKIYNKYPISYSQTTTEKITNMIKLLDHYSKPFNRSPEHLIEFKNKSTIIC